MLNSGLYSTSESCSIVQNAEVCGGNFSLDSNSKRTSTSEDLIDSSCLLSSITRRGANDLNCADESKVSEP